MRRWGPASAPLQFDFLIDINCAHCADQFSATLATVQPYVDAGTAEVVVRWWPRPRDAAASDLITHVLATADQQEFRLLSSLVVGTPEGRTWQFLRPRLAELVDPAAIEQRLPERRGAIAQILAADAAHIARWSITAVPSLIVTDRASAVRGRWDGKQFQLQTITTALAAATALPGAEAK